MKAARATGWLAAGLLATACGVGDGSDIGPALPQLPDDSCKVVVLDDQGRAVVGATVTVGSARAITGRNGRGDLLASPRGRVLVEVAAADAAAVAGDRLAGFGVATTVVGPDLPAVLHVPELPAAAGAAVDLGTQATTTTITSTAGASLVVPTGASVGAAATTSPVTVALGDLQAQHLPGELPAAPSGAWLCGRAVWVDPVDLTITPGANLDVADDLGLGSGSAQLFHLDPTTGEWQAVAVAATAGAGRLVAADGVTTGGLYVFATPVVATTVSGRLLDAATPPAPVPGAMVVVDQVKAITDANGRYVAAGVAATLADGSPRSGVVEAFAGGSWLPARAVTTVAVTTAATAAGDLVLDTIVAGNIRVQQVLQGRAEARGPARLSSLRGDVALATTSDANGQLLFEDVPADYFGFQDGRPIDANEVVYGQSIGFLERGRRWLDAYQFFLERTWYQGGRRSRALVSDAFGGGPLENATIVQGSVAGQGSAGLTREGGTLFITRDFAGRATASLRSARDGRVFVHAFSIERPNGEHLELPLQRVLRTPLGAFERHGLVAGSLTGADPSRQHELRAGRYLSVQEWWDEIVEDGAPSAAVPLDVDPATTHDAFVVGVPAAGGHVAAIETTSPGGVKTLQKLGIAADLAPTEGGRITRDVALDSVADETFGIVNALLGAPPELDLAQLSMALALQQPSGRIVDVARGLRGNHAASGIDLALALPALTGPLAGHGWLVLLDGSYPSNGSTVSCSALISVPRPSSLPSFPLGAVRFNAFPEIASPANGAVVPATGFTVQFTLPTTALHGMLELRSESGGETLLWQVLLPPDAAQFTFVALPVDAATPLLAGRTWSLTVSAWFGDGAVAGAVDPYGYLATFAQSIGAVERGAHRVLRRTIQITTN